MATEYGGNTYNKYGQPSLDLVFTGPKKSLKNRVGNQQVEFTRDTIGTYIDENGIIKTAVADEARFEKEGLLIEESRANIYKYSNLMNPTNGSTPSNFTANAGTAPDGTNTAFKLVQKPSSDGVVLQGQSFSIGAKDGPLAVFSVFAKAGEDRYLYITPYLSVSLTPPVFDLQTGTISNPDNHAAVMRPLANGWYRCSLRVRRGGFASMRWGISNVADAPFANNGVQFEGDGTSGLLVWGAQYELQTPNAVNGDSPITIEASSVIPTTGSAITRAADVCTITGDNFSSWYNQSEGTVVTKITDNGEPARVIFHLGRGQGNGDNRIITTTGANYGAYVETAATQVNMPGGWYTKGVETVGAFAFKQDNFALATDGVIRGTDNSGDLPTCDRLYLFMNRNASDTITGHISRITYYPRRLSNAELQTITL